MISAFIVMLNICVRRLTAGGVVWVFACDPVINVSEYFRMESVPTYLREAQFQAKWRDHVELIVFS